MRRMLGFTLVGVLGLTFQIAGCAEGSTLGPNETGGGGSGANGNEGGSGGNQCTTEICDGFDNDCDGDTDEGCACRPGETGSCYSGPPSTVDIGSCKSGSHTCDEATHTFGPCTNEVVPASEICNGGDDDCNGQVDDGIADVMCGVGACHVVMAGCMAGMPVNCLPGMPSPEICDGIDNDCNMAVDDTYPEQGQPCDTGQMGVCGLGENQCLMGVVSCKTINMPSMETCDELDNDCNGMVDDGIPGLGVPCSTGLSGTCSMGTYLCRAGVADCYPDNEQSTELCDGMDNNCNGQIDENNAGGGGACTTTMSGACALGTQVCSGAMLVCQPKDLMKPETCNGLDDNCNGQSDEGNPGSGQTCSCGGTSACSAGKIVCQGCTREFFCNNGTDDDADNKIDCQDGDCSLGCNASVGPCAAGETLFVLKATNVPQSIQNLSTATSTMVISEAMTIKRVVMALKISHTYDNDLLITLKSPAGTVRTMSANNGGSNDNYTNTIFHSGCTTPITSGSPPFAGCFAPEQSMTAYNNQTTKGTWTLSVSDQSPLLDVGTLDAWTLAICAK